jgi:hypothetical protein
MTKWIFLVVCISVSIGILSALDSSTLTGSWNGEYSAKDGTLQLQFMRDGSNHGFRVSLQSLKGLTVEMILSKSQSVTFQLIREAGRIHCTGFF